MNPKDGESRPGDTGRPSSGEIDTGEYTQAKPQSQYKTFPPVYSKQSKTWVVDLKSLAGNMYKTGLDPAALCPGEGRKDPEYVTIPGKYGEFYGFDATRVGVSVASAKVAARMGRELKGKVTLHCGGGDESIFIFEPVHFREVAKYIKPRRKRRLTEDQRKQAVERLKDYRFSRTSEQAQEKIRREDEPIHA